jgi:hypothetical protein
MNGRIVTDEQVHEAVDFLTNTVGEAARVTAEAKRAEYLVKHKLALEMKRHDGSAAAQEREARASEIYLEACERDAIAAGELAKYKAEREVKQIIVSVWQSQGANQRGSRP